MRASISSNDAWQWIVLGWKTFLKSPVLWVVLALVYIVSIFVLSHVPLIGAFLAALLTPVLIGGMLHAARELEAGREVTPVQLVQTFSKQPTLIQLGLLGLVPLVVTLLQNAIMASAIPQALALPLVFAVSLMAACVLLYALPLVALSGQQAIDAASESLRMCRKAPLAIAVFLGLSLLLLIVSLIPLGLGLLICLPVIVGAIHASYRHMAQA